MIRTGVWGVGVWGEKHARVYHALPGATLAGVYDRDAARAREVSAMVSIMSPGCIGL